MKDLTADERELAREGLKLIMEEAKKERRFWATVVDDYNDRYLPGLDVSVDQRERWLESRDAAERFRKVENARWRAAWNARRKLEAEPL